MKVAVVGGGIAGLAAARTLTQRGTEVVVFEQTATCGGRCATTRLGDYLFDTGVTSIAPRGRTIEKVLLEELDTSDLQLVTTPIYTHNGSRILPGDRARNQTPRYAYRSGNGALGALLAHGLDVRLETAVARFKRTGKTYELSGESFDGLILTPPTPLTEQLLEASGERRSIGQASYRPCLSVLLGYETVPPTMAYHALIEPEQRHPLTWLSMESVKCPGRAPLGCTALIAQMSPSYSRQEYDSEDSRIVHDAAAFISRLYGPDWLKPAVSGVKRWRYSLPESLALFESVNAPGATLIVAGDALLGGRVEFAFETGVWAARLLLGESLVGVKK